MGTYYMDSKIELERTRIDTVQVNVGDLCNQSCSHCHVEASPKGTNVMEWSVFEQIVRLLGKSPFVRYVDITGGAPEMNPFFRPFIEAVTALGKTIISRCNLTILLEDGQEDTAAFLARHHVEVVASLPCYLEDNVDQQRGGGVYQKSIEALKLLNSYGYGADGGERVLTLVYNPLSPSLGPDQSALELDYKMQLKERFGIVFSRLIVLTNMPITRYAHWLQKQGELDRYRLLLREHFNPKAPQHSMCRTQISIGWDGRLYDCDFNQALNMALGEQTVRHLRDFDDLPRPILTAEHCYGCWAGSGSSCGGAIT